MDTLLFTVLMFKIGEIMKILPVSYRIFVFPSIVSNISACYWKKIRQQLTPSSTEKLPRILSCFHLMTAQFLNSGHLTTSMSYLVQREQANHVF